MGKDFPIHGTSLEVKTKTPSNVTFKVQPSYLSLRLKVRTEKSPCICVKVAGQRDSKTTHIAGDIEAKYLDPKNGLTFTQAWTTSNVLRTQVELDNQIAKGLKLDLTTSLLPDKGHKSALLNAVYKQPGLHSRAFLDVFKVRS